MDLVKERLPLFPQELPLGPDPRMRTVPDELFAALLHRADFCHLNERQDEG
jgi:hypothetical protein